MKIKKIIGLSLAFIMLFSLMTAFAASENSVEDNFDSYSLSATEGGWGGKGTLADEGKGKSVVIGGGNGDLLNKSIGGFSEDVKGLIANFSIKFTGATNKEVIFGAGTNNGVAATSRMLQFSSSGKMQALATADFNIPIAYTTGVWYDVSLKINYDTGYYFVSVSDGTETKTHTFTDEKFKRDSSAKSGIKYYSFWISDANSDEKVYIDNVNIFGTTDNRIYPELEEKKMFDDFSALAGGYSVAPSKEINPGTVKIPVKGSAEIEVILEDSAGNSEQITFSGSDTDIYLTVKEGNFIYTFADSEKVITDKRETSLKGIKNVKVLSESVTKENIEYILFKSATFFELTASNISGNVLPDKKEITLSFSGELPQNNNGSINLSGDRSIEEVIISGKTISIILDENLSPDTEYTLSYTDICDFEGSKISGEIKFKTDSALKSENPKVSEEEGNYIYSVSLKSNTGKEQDGIIAIGVYDENGKMLSGDIQKTVILTESKEFKAVAEKKENAIAEGFTADSLFGKITEENVMLEKCEIDKEGNLTLSGKCESDKIKVFILDSKNTLASFETLSEKPDFFREFNVDDGSFSVSIPLAGGVKGYKDIVIRGDRSEHYKKAFYLISKSDLDAFILGMNSAKADDEEIEEYILSNLDVIGEEESVYAENEEIREKTAKFLIETRNFKYEKFESTEEIKKAFNFALMCALINDENVEEIFSEYTDKTFLSDESFGGYFENDLESLVKALEKVERAEEFYRFTGETLILSSIKNASTYVKVEDILLDNEEFLGIDLTAYKKLKDKSSVNKKLMKNCSDLETLSESIKKYVKEVNKKPVSSGGGSTGGGGVSANTGGYTSGVFENTPLEIEYFNDLGSVSWAKESINALAEKGIVNGVGKGEFQPQRPVTREEFVKIIVGAFLQNAKAGDTVFEDVTEEDWCYEYVLKAASSGYVKGISENTFGKGKNITREDAAVILSRIYGKSLKGRAEFKDSDKISAYAYDGVNTMALLGVISGDENKNFNPQKPLTRAECAKIVYGLYKGMEGK